jgi:hypothetical protein
MYRRDAAPRSSPAETSPPAGSADDGRVQNRLSFSIDTVDYSSRRAADKLDVQQRIRSVVHEVPRDMGLHPAGVDAQSTGDGMTVLLPECVEVHRALAHLPHMTHKHMEQNNSRYLDLADAGGNWSLPKGR